MTTLEPDALDGYLRRLRVLADTRDLAELRSRWGDHVDRSTSADVATMLGIAKFVVRSRVAELLDQRVSAEGIYGIAATCLNRIGLEDPASSGQLIADCCMTKAHHRIDDGRARRLPWLITAIGWPADIESVRVPFLTEWWAASPKSTETDRVTTESDVLDTIIRAAPADWTSISGTVSAAAGLARAHLRVTRPDGVAGIAAPMRIPALHRLRAIDRAAGSPWWQAVVDITPDSRSLTTTSPDEPLPPIDLMRPSEYLAEAQVTGSSLPNWLAAYCDSRLLDGTPVLSPGAATDTALLRWAIDGVDVDPRSVTIERTAVGYRVRSMSTDGVRLAEISDPSADD